MHGKGRASIAGSAVFLQDYATTLKTVSRRPQSNISKEKVDEGSRVSLTRPVEQASG
jgi:hypothetical protein